MSLHVVNPELEAQLAAQRRNSTIASIIVGILLMALVALAFWAIGVHIFTERAEPMVAFQEETLVEDEIEKEKITTEVQKTPPSSPSSASPPIISAATTSDFSIPSPEVATESLAVDFGDSEGFASGWGGGSGTGFGSGGGSSFSLMGEKISGERICFVIDYSASMGGQRIKLLKEELNKTIEKLPNGTEYQMIFFAGPAWIAGSNVNSNKGGATIKYEGKEFKWEGKGAHNWWQVGRKQPVEWLKQSSSVRKKSLEAIQNTGLVWGTSWTAPVEMALDMKPKPELVVFLTDGASGGDSFEKAQKLGRTARAKRIKVNTIALMEPKARDAMAELARAAGGSFSLIGADGKKVEQKMEKKGGIKKAGQ